jgi:hypothetical protein
VLPDLLIRKHVASGTIVHADESGAWDALHASYDMRRVNHSIEYVSDDGANVNQAESWVQPATPSGIRRPSSDQRSAPATGA